MTIQEPLASGSLPSTTTLASVMLSAADPASAFVSVPARFWTTSNEDSRSPRATPNEPVSSEKLSIVSGLNALTRPCRR